jgi:hypothetical protein
LNISAASPVKAITIDERNSQASTAHDSSGVIKVKRNPISKSLDRQFRRTADSRMRKMKAWTNETLSLEDRILKGQFNPVWKDDKEIKSQTSSFML